MTDMTIKLMCAMPAIALLLLLAYYCAKQAIRSIHRLGRLHDEDYIADDDNYSHGMVFNKETEKLENDNKLNV